jgi:hypothetical protein
LVFGTIWLASPFAVTGGGIGWLDLKVTSNIARGRYLSCIIVNIYLNKDDMHVNIFYYLLFMYLSAYIE